MRTIHFFSPSEAIVQMYIGGPDLTPEDKLVDVEVGQVLEAIINVVPEAREAILKLIEETLWVSESPPE